MEKGRQDIFYQDYGQDICKVKLENKELWKKFHDLETEMIITKSGRRMFPSLRVQISGLDPSAHYSVLIEFTPASNCRYKYSSSSGWAPAGSEETHSPHRVYLHPESPATGEQWMSQPISFGRLKLTNTPTPPLGQVVLSSMHKYQPKIIIVKSVDPRMSWAPSTTIVFPETQFIAVTAYQNEKITKLKIDNNPFAKGFRENGQSRCKRKRHADESSSEDTDVQQECKRRPPSATSSVISDCKDDQRSPTSSPEVILNDTPPPRFVPYYPNSNLLTQSSFYYNYRYPYQLPSPTTRAYYFPQYVPYPPATWSNPLFLSHPSSVSCIPQDLSLNKSQKPTKLTDFSIRALTGAL